MALSPAILINKSGKVVPVYDSNGAKKIGQLEKNEAYARYGNEGTLTSIHFLGPNGKFIAGMLKAPASKATTPCTNYPYGTVTINNTKYYTFKMRSKKTIITPNGNSWGSVASGCRVACLDACAGQTKQWTKQIHYVENTSGKWVKVTGDGKNYGFVDTGLKSGSSPTSIAMYGKW